MKKRLLADVLWEAANEHLPIGDPMGFCVYSCNAALKAEFGTIPFRINKHGAEVVDRRNSKTQRFLNDLGCTKAIDGGFKNYSDGSTRQGVRYMWLLLAMHVAEDEGITV